MIVLVSTFLLLVFCVEFRDFQRFTPREMRRVLINLNYTNDEQSLKCQPVIEEKWFPEFPYFYYTCDLSENLTKTLIEDVDKKTCPGFDCWESQLSDSSRLEILNIMNTYRQKVAEGTCERFCNGTQRLVFELRWFYLLENQAQKNVKKCRRSLSKTQKIIGGSFYNNRTVIFDVISVSFEMRTTFQREIRLILWRLLQNNALNDWNERSGTFRRGLAFDVGCAFVLRRNTDDITFLNENVKSGNVGHFSCVFATTAKSLDAPLDLTPSLKDCGSTSVPYPTKFNDTNYYPSLCKITLALLEEALHFPFCICQVEPQFVDAKICDQSEAMRSQKTWNEVSYGYALKYDSYNKKLLEAKCNLPHPDSLIKLPAESADGMDFVCSLKQEVHVRGNPNTCGKWNCRDSQLKDETKERILTSLNQARSLVAQALCPKDCPSPCKYCSTFSYCNMVKLRWHWFLEMRAAWVVEQCSETYESDKLIIDGPFPSPVSFETVSLVFDLPPSGQINLPTRITELFWINAFDDWAENLKFRRANALWIGCAIITRPGAKIRAMKSTFRLKNGIATHMTCIYGAPQKNFESVYGNNDEDCCPKCPEPRTWFFPCLADSTRNITPYPALCTSTLSDVTMTCEVNDCKSGESEAWETVLAGTTIYEDVDGSFRNDTRIPRSPPSTTEHPLSTIETPVAGALPSIYVYAKKYCTILLMILIILLSLLSVVSSLIFKFLTEKQVFEKKSFPKTRRAAPLKSVKPLK